MKKTILIILLFLGIAVNGLISDAYAKYILEKSINAVSLEVSTLYNINYNLNGGNISGEKSKYTINYSFKLPQPERNGYNFEGWTGSNGATPIKDVNVIKGTTGNLSYNANWNPINYAITYNLNGGTLNNKVNNYNIETATFTIGTPTRDGYEFIGWSGSKTTVEKGTIGNLLYTANWKQKLYTVTYLNPDGSYYSSSSIEYNSTIPAIGYGVDQIHIFNGWYYNGTNINDVKMPEYNISVVASIREANGYIITGQATDGDTSRIARFAELISHKGLGGHWQQEASGYYSYVSDWSNYSHIMDTANYLMNNAPKNSWPYLRWLAVSFENGYTIQLR